MTMDTSDTFVATHDDNGEPRRSCSIFCFKADDEPRYLYRCESCLLGVVVSQERGGPSFAKAWWLTHRCPELDALKPPGNTG